MNKRLAICVVATFLFGVVAVRAQVTGRVMSADPAALAQGNINVPVRIVLDDVSLLDTFVLDGPFVETTAQFTTELRATPLVRLSEETFQTLVSATANAPPGSYRFEVIDTGTLPQTNLGSFFVRIAAGGSLAAPVGVTTVAVVHPRPGALIAPGEQVYPRGVLTTTGSGAVTGSWTLDGIPFERFMVSTYGGEPLAVTARMAIPLAASGSRQLALVVDSPQRAVSEPVEVIRTGPRATLMRSVAPRPDAVTVAAPGADSPAFRWTPQPGAESYEVLLSRAPRELPETVAFHAYESPWSLPEDAWTGLDAGRWYWSVRPVFPGRVRGEELPWQALTLLPASVTLEAQGVVSDPVSGDLFLSWSGGVPGMLYRVEVLPVDETTAPLIDALTFEDSYRLPVALLHDLDAGSAPLRWRVQAHGPDGARLGSLETAMLPTVSAANSASVAIIETLELSPPDGGEIDERRPAIRLRWRGVVARERIAVILDGRDVSGLSVLEAERIEFQPPQDLAPGEHEVLVFLGSEAVAWRFRVAGEPVPGAGGPAEPTETGLAGLPLDWSLDIGGEVTWISGNEPDETDEARLVGSVSLDSEGSHHDAAIVGDVSYRMNLDDAGSTEQESRSYVLRGRRELGRAALLGTAGYFSPAALDQSTYLSSGLSRAGAELGVEGPFGQLLAYGTYDDTVDGQSSGIQGAEQRVRAASYRPPIPDRRGFVRLLALDATEPGSTSIGLPRSEGRAFGALGRFRLTPAWGLGFEAARSKIDRAGAENLRGESYRVRVDGRLKERTAIDLSLWRNDGDYANPASPSLVPGSVPDRTGGEIGLMRTLGEGLLNLRFKTEQSGRASRSAAPNATQHLVTASYGRPFASANRLQVDGSWSRADSDEDAAAGAPAVTLENYGVNVVVSQQVRGFSLTQSVGWLATRDRSDTPPLFEDPEQDTYSANVSGTGSLSTRWTFTGSAAWTRSDPAQRAGTRSLTISIQPVWKLEAWGLRISPWLSETRTDTDGLQERLRQAQLVVGWGGRRRFNGLGAQVSAGWVEYVNLQGLPGKTDDTSVVGTLSWSWGLPRSGVAGGTSILAGAESL